MHVDLPKDMKIGSYDLNLQYNYDRKRYELRPLTLEDTRVWITEDGTKVNLEELTELRAKELINRISPDFINQLLVTLVIVMKNERQSDETIERRIRFLLEHHRSWIDGSRLRNKAESEPKVG